MIFNKNTLEKKYRIKRLILKMMKFKWKIKKEKAKNNFAYNKQKLI